MMEDATMKQQKDQICLVKNFLTGKCHLRDINGRRLTSNFRIVNTVDLGGFVELATDKGTYIYNKNYRRLLYKDTESKQAGRIECITDNVYAISCYNGNEGRCKLYSPNGERLTQEIFAMVYGLPNGLIGLQTISEEWGIADENLEWIIEPRYEDLVDYPDLFICYHKNHEATDLIKFNGKEIEYVQYLVGSFQKEITPNHYLVRLNEKFGVVSPGGNVIIPIIYDSIKKISNYFVVELNDNYGLVDMDGNVVKECKYFRIIQVNDGIIRAILREVKVTIEDIPV